MLAGVAQLLMTLSKCVLSSAEALRPCVDSKDRTLIVRSSCTDLSNLSSS